VVKAIVGEDSELLVHTLVVVERTSEERDDLAIYIDHRKLVEVWEIPEWASPNQSIGWEVIVVIATSGEAIKGQVDTGENSELLREDV